MKKSNVYLILTIVFVLLTFLAAWYVLKSKGTASAAIAVVPCALAIAFSNLYLQNK